MIRGKVFAGQGNLPTHIILVGHGHDMRHMKVGLLVENIVEATNKALGEVGILGIPACALQGKLLFEDQVFYQIFFA